MISSRDFILYCAIVAFLLMGAIYTGFTGSNIVNKPRPLSIDVDSEIHNPTAFEEVAVDERTERIRSLQAKLAAGEGSIDSAPPVFTSVDQLRAAEAASSAAAIASTSISSQSVQYCGAASIPASISNWPNISEVRFVDGEQMFYTQIEKEVLVGTSTEITIETKVAFTLPVRTIRTGFDSCLPDVLIGTTPTGAPLFNTTATQYETALPETLLGYTRDGFSIYGPLLDSASLDSCGGQVINGTYQYHVRPGQTSLIGCYAGIPVDVVFN